MARKIRKQFHQVHFTAKLDEHQHFKWYDGMKPIEQFLTIYTSTKRHKIGWTLKYGNRITTKRRYRITFKQAEKLYIQLDEYIRKVRGTSY